MFSAASTSDLTFDITVEIFRLDLDVQLPSRRSLRQAVDLQLGCPRGFRIGFWDSLWGSTKSFKLRSTDNWRPVWIAPKEMHNVVNRMLENIVIAAVSKFPLRLPPIEISLWPTWLLSCRQCPCPLDFLIRVARWLFIFFSKEPYCG